MLSLFLVGVGVFNYVFIYSSKDFKIFYIKKITLMKVLNSHWIESLLKEGILIQKLKHCVKIINLICSKYTTFNSNFWHLNVNIF
jgi:hypothetical protein